MWNVRLLNFVRLLSLWLFWPGVVLIAWGELTPNPPDLSMVFDWDKLEHFTAYFGLAAMAAMVLERGPRLAGAIFGIILFGGVLEILQGYTGRDPDIFDFAANSVGAFAGLGAAMILRRALTPLVGARAAD